MESLTIRPVREGDAEGILRVYAPFVRETIVSMEREVPSPEAFLRRIQGIADEYPYLVCVSGGEIAGYAYAHRHMERAGYAWNAELSIYLGEGFRSRGIGRAIYSCLMEILTLQGVRNLYAGVTLPNLASQRLHESFGFRPAAVYHNTGFKQGKWHDVVWYEKSIGDYPENPPPFLPIGRVDQAMIGEILAKYERVLRSR